MWEQPLGPLSSNTTTRLFLAGTLRFPGTNPQGLFLVALPLGLLSCNLTVLQEVQAAATHSLGLLLRLAGSNAATETLSLGLLLRLLGSNAPGLFCHAETLRLLGSRLQGLLFLALPIGLLLFALSLGLISCNATGLLFHAETLSLGLLLPAQPLRLLGSSALGQL